MAAAWFSFTLVALATLPVLAMSLDTSDCDGFLAICGADVALALLPFALLIDVVALLLGIQVWRSRPGAATAQAATYALAVLFMVAIALTGSLVALGVAVWFVVGTAVSVAAAVEARRLSPGSDDPPEPGLPRNA